MLDDAILLQLRREKIKLGQYRISKHATEQQEKRGIDLPDILHVLKYGIHETKKTLSSCTGVWKYAIKGKIEDTRIIRVIIAFAEDMIIITVIDVSK